MPSKEKRKTFIIAGGGEAQEGRNSYYETLVARGDTSLEGLRAKVRWVMGEMERRLEALGVSWQDAVTTQAYTVRDIGPLVGPEIFAKGAAPGGLAWHYCRPPLVDLEYEMDVRGAAREIAL